MLGLVISVARTTLAGEILHFHAVRYRLTGKGNLKTTLRSLDNATSSDLADIPMSVATNREPLVLANFVDQRGQLEVKTTAFGETFTISKIIIFVKTIFTGYPQ